MTRWRSKIWTPPATHYSTRDARRPPREPRAGPRSAKANETQRTVNVNPGRTASDRKPVQMVLERKGKLNCAEKDHVRDLPGNLEGRFFEEKFLELKGQHRKNGKSHSWTFIRHFKTCFSCQTSKALLTVGLICFEPFVYMYVIFRSCLFLSVSVCRAEVLIVIMCCVFECLAEVFFVTVH